MGDGGGWASSRGEVTPVSTDEGEVGDTAGSEDLLREKRPLRPDFTDPASDLSPASPLDNSAELRGLSVLAEEPGIFDLRVLKDLVESLVSDLLNDGNDCKPSGLRSPAPAELLGLGVLLPSFDGWFPIARVTLVKSGQEGQENAAG